MLSWVEHEKSFKTSEPGLYCPLTESLDTTECINGKQKPGRYFAHALNDLNPRILRMSESTFSLDGLYSNKDGV